MWWTWAWEFDKESDTRLVPYLFLHAPRHPPPFPLLVAILFTTSRGRSSSFCFLLLCMQYRALQHENCGSRSKIFRRSTGAPACLQDTGDKSLRVVAFRTERLHFLRVDPLTPSDPMAPLGLLLQSVRSGTQRRCVICWPWRRTRSG